MMYYRIALQGSQPATWQWKSIPFTSPQGVLAMLKLYHNMPAERIRVFLSTSLERMDEMLSRANQQLPSTAVRVDQLSDKHSTSWVEVRRLELELGAGGDHDCPYTWNLPSSAPHLLAWSTLLARRECGEFES
jgi:hypothetical protein